MRSNAKLKIVRVRDGSLLDEESLALLAKMADAEGYQVWIERVDSGGRVGFVIEDGQLREATSMPKMSKHERVIRDELADVEERLEAKREEWGQTEAQVNGLEFERGILNRLLRKANGEPEPEWVR